MLNTWQELEQIQPTVTKMLGNSFKKGRLAHAYLFEGMRGTGKKETAILFAKSLFCTESVMGYLPCNKCYNCKRIASGNHPDLHVLEPDGLSIKKAQIQELQEEFSKTAVESKQKMYIIIHADRMTVNAANSLLKFLEEPHQGTTAILVTEQVQKILPTILSRCQLLTFQPLTPLRLIEKMKQEGVHEKKAPMIAQLTNNLDEAIKLSEDDWFAQAQKIVLKLYEVFSKSPLSSMLILQEEWFSHFKDKEQLDQGLDLLLLLYKDLLSVQLGKSDQIVYVSEANRIEQHALHIAGEQIADRMAFILESKRKLASNMNPQLLMEELVLKLQEGSSFV